ncbi:MAG: hypothetical protein ACW974_07405, partial [Candidatus Thorarchaeota archaeon]
WVLTAEGQAHWLNPEALRVPVIEAAFDEPGVDAFWGPFLENVFTETAEAVVASGFEFNDTLSSAISYAFRAYFQAVFTNAQTQLVACWEKLAEARRTDVIDDAAFKTYTDRMGQMYTAADKNATYYGGLFGIDMATRLNAALKGDDEILLGHFQDEWYAAAIANYAAILGDVLAEPGW